MPERTTITQVVQIGVEVTPGTGVAANKALQSLSIMPAPKMDIKTFRAMGRKYKSLAVLGKEWTESKIEGLATYDELPYFLASLVGFAAPVQQGTTAAYLWTHASNTDSPDTVKTYTVEQGSSVRAHKFTNGIIIDGGMAISREEVKLSGNMLGGAITDGITMTASPTELPLIPILPTDIDIYLADTQAELDAASALLRVLSVEWNVGERFGPIYPLGSANGTGFAATIEKEPSTDVKMTMEADAAGMALLTTARAGSKKFLRIQSVGDVIEDTETYLFQADFCLRVVGVDEFKDEDGLYAIGWNFEFMHDDTWGKAYEFQVQNTLTAL